MNRVCNICGVDKPVLSFSKGKRYRDGYRPQCKSCINNKQMTRRLANKAHVNEQARKYYWQNPLKMRERTRSYQAGNPTKLKARRALDRPAKKRWKNNNPEKVSEYGHRRRARLYNAEGNHTAQQIADLYRKQKGKCIYCKCKINGKYHKDHIMPLELGGTNNIENIQLTCQSCNLSKGHRNPITFAQTVGLLF